MDDSTTETSDSRLESLLQLRDALNDMGDGLYHATRVMVLPHQEEADDVKLDWEEFLPGEDTFGHVAFRLDGPERRVQHSCFYGRRDLQPQFTALAAKVAVEVPMTFLPHLSPNPKDREARSDSNQWMLAVYRIAYQTAGLLPVTRDVQRNGEGSVDNIDRGFFDPLALAANLDGSKAHGFQTWLKSYETVPDTRPRYVYATLSFDAPTSSVIAIDYLVENWDRLFTPVVPDDIADVVPFESKIGDDISEEQPGYLGITFDRDKGEITRKDKITSVHLSNISKGLFHILFRAGGGTVSFSDLTPAWGGHEDVTNEKIHSAIRHLRKKLKPLSIALKNERGKGYKLIDSS